jgi:selenoprotein W-related protein
MNRIEIEYCPKCHWLPRAAWMAQELLGTFAEEVQELVLRPSAESGAFRVSVNGERISDRKQEGGFPEIAALKRAIRDRVAPGRALGHVDRVKPED